MQTINKCTSVGFSPVTIFMSLTINPWAKFYLLLDCKPTSFNYNSKITWLKGRLKAVQQENRILCSLGTACKMW
jgi:hypothetical protein